MRLHYSIIIVMIKIKIKYYCYYYLPAIVLKTVMRGRTTEGSILTTYNALPQSRFLLYIYPSVCLSVCLIPQDLCLFFAFICLHSLHKNRFFYPSFCLSVRPYSSGSVSFFAIIRLESVSYTDIKLFLMFFTSLPIF